MGETFCLQPEACAAVQLLGRVENILDHSLATVFVWRYEAGKWPVEYVSDSVAQFGYTPEEFLSGAVLWPGITHPDDVARLESEIAGFIACGIDKFSQHYRLFAKSGEVRHIEDWNVVVRNQAGDITHVQGLILDLTSRKAAEAALRASETRYRMLMEDAVDLILVLDEKRRIIDTNAMASELLGYSREELIGIDPEDFMSRQELANSPIPWNDVNNGETVIDTRSLRHKHGHYLVMEGRLKKMPDGKIQVFARDITLRRELEKQIFDTVRQEQQHIGLALHDSLGQELTGISFLVKALDHELQEIAPAAVDATRRIAELVKEAIKTTRGIARGLSPVDMVADGLAASLEQLALGTSELYGINCRCEIADSAFVDDNAIATHLYQIAQESVHNAVRHGQAKHIAIRLIGAKNGQGTLIVTDDGKGLQKLGRSNGLGLRIMQHRSDVIGGSIKFESEVRGGFTVRCFFPNTRPSGALGLIKG